MQVEREPREQRGGGHKATGKKRKLAVDECGNEYKDGQTFEVEAIVGTRISAGPKADKSERYPKGTKLYRIIWEGYAAEAATWEPESNIGDDLLAEFEAGLDAEAELEAEEERELQVEEADDCEDRGIPISFPRL